MKKLISQIMVSVDGYFEGPNQESDWHNVDEDYNVYAVGLLDSVDVILFGRVTYQLMESYWPTPAAISKDPIIADRMNQLPKVVFSTTLDRADWKSTTLVKDHMIEKIKTLKQQPGKDLVVLGSGMLVSELTRHRLIDEYQLMVNPVILGKGNALLKKIENQMELQLVDTKSFPSGNVLLRYACPVNGS